MSVNLKVCLKSLKDLEEGGSKVPGSEGQAG